MQTTKTPSGSGRKSVTRIQYKQGHARTWRNLAMQSPKSTETNPDVGCQKLMGRNPCAGRILVIEAAPAKYDPRLTSACFVAGEAWRSRNVEPCWNILEEGSSESKHFMFIWLICRLFFRNKSVSVHCSFTVPSVTPWLCSESPNGRLPGLVMP